MKKWHFLILACLLVVTLCGCCISHDWQEATCSAPKTCAKCGKTEGEPLPHTWVDATCAEPKTCEVCGETEGEPLGHSWVDATYHEPKTCTICGETEGTAKKSFFEEHRLSVSDQYKKLTLTSCVVDNHDHPTRTAFCPTSIVFNSHFVRPSYSREDYKTIKLCFTGRVLVPSFAAGGQSPLGDLCDYYTGYSFEQRGTDGDDEVELYDSVIIDGIKYKIYYSVNVEYPAVMKWSAEEQSYFTQYEVTYLVDVPNQYDGLVFYIDDVDEWDTDVTDIHSGTVEGSYNCHYFWLGRE